jgi:hypothetical protein
MSAKGESDVSGRRATRKTIVGLGLGLSLLANLGAAAPGAFAREASDRASCIGIELSAISPPGSSGEVPGGAPEFGRAVKAIAGELGVPPGALYSFVAHLHEGSHEACDEATE